MICRHLSRSVASCDAPAMSSLVHSFKSWNQAPSPLAFHLPLHQYFLHTVLPVYGSETWALKKAHMELLSVAQCKMERIILGITLRDHKRNTWIRHQTGVNDIIDVIKKGIHGWAGHIARFNDNRWTKRVTEWTPR